jgi:hypothetical protein
MIGMASIKITLTIDPFLWADFKKYIDDYPEFSYSSWIQYQIAQFVRAEKERKVLEGDHPVVTKATQ